MNKLKERITSIEKKRIALYIDIANAMNDTYHNAKMIHQEPPRKSSYDENFFQSGVFEDLLQIYIDDELRYINADESKRDGWKNFMRDMFGEFGLHGKYGSTFTNDGLFDVLQGSNVSPSQVKETYGWMSMTKLQKMLRGLEMTTVYAEKSMKRFFKLLYSGNLK
jgi:hypothetical protein